MKAQYSVGARERRGMTMREMEEALTQAKNIGVDPDSVLNVENFMVFDFGCMGMPLSKVHFEIPKINNVTQFPTGRE